MSGKAPLRRSSRIAAAQPLHKEDSVHQYSVPKKQTRAEKELDKKKTDRASRPNRGLRRANTFFEYEGHPETRETSDNPFGKLVGHEVEVWFPKKKEWVKGKVLEYHAFDGLHVVEYPGKERLFHNFGKVKYRFPGKAQEKALVKSDSDGAPSPKKAKKSDIAASSASSSSGDDHVVTPVVAYTAPTSPKKKSAAASSSATTITGPAEVDPASGLADKGKVLVEGSDVYDAQMTLLDLSKNMDKYYRLQVVVSNAGDEYWTVFHWGRTGTAGQFSTESHGSDKDKAIDSFKAKFHDKSGINFDERDGATPVPGKYQIKKTSAYVAPADGQNVYWQYYVDDFVDGKATGWYNYTDTAAGVVEGVFSEWQNNSWLCVRCVQSGYFEYRVDFNSMTQTNLRTSKCRKIRRVIAASPPTQ